MYLDAETYRMYFNNATNNCFEVDALIAKTIQLLNRKGYKTEYCCSGHYGSDKTEIVDVFDENENVIGVTEVSEIRSSIYVSFADSVQLPYIPEGWYVDEMYPSVIRAMVDDNAALRNKDGIEGLRERLRVFKEIVKRNAQLYDWAKKLPDLTLSNEKNNGGMSTGV